MCRWAPEVAASGDRGFARSLIRRLLCRRAALARTCRVRGGGCALTPAGARVLGERDLSVPGRRRGRRYRGAWGSHGVRSAAGAAWCCEKMSELAVGGRPVCHGFKLERELRASRNGGPSARLLLVAMPLTIAGVALFGVLGRSACRSARRSCSARSLRRPTLCWPATSASGRRGTRRSASRTSRSPARPVSTTAWRSRFCSWASSWRAARDRRLVRGLAARGRGCTRHRGLRWRSARRSATGFGAAAVRLRDRGLMARRARRLARGRRRARDLRSDGDRQRLRLFGRVRRRRRLAPLRARHEYNVGVHDGSRDRREVR